MTLLRAYGVHGQVTGAQAAVLRTVVGGREVCDLGAGNGVLSLYLRRELGAARVVAVDAHDCSIGRVLVNQRGIEFRRCTFAEFAETAPELDVAFLSWPTNCYAPGLHAILCRARTIAYLGKCTDGSMCGTPDLFELFAYRELLHYVPDPGNTLAVYGDVLRERRRDLRGEERAGLRALSLLLTYEEAEAGLNGREITTARF